MEIRLSLGMLVMRDYKGEDFNGILFVCRGMKMDYNYKSGDELFTLILRPLSIGFP